MKGKIFVVLLFALAWTQIVQCKRRNIQVIDCHKDVGGHALNLTAMSGYWFEAARVPKMDIMKCLNVSVPATADRRLKLHLEYISTINNKVHAVRETIAFPWNNYTKNSVFHLDYGSVANRSISVTYKVLYSDPNLMTILCGYSTISPMPLFKLLTRQRQLDPQVIEVIQAEADKRGIGSQIIWTEQSPAQCNAAVRPTTGLTTNLLVLSILCSLAKFKHKWLTE